jgi:hypothetical protein
MKTLILALMVAGCGTSKSTSAISYNNSDFSSYVAHFEAIAQTTALGPNFKVTSPITISDTELTIPNFTAPAGEFIGATCTCDSAASHKITLAPGWVHLSPTTQEIGLLHELGHCELGRPHLETAKPDGTAESVMNSTGATDSEYAGNQPYYDTELVSVQNKDCSTMGGSAIP